MISIFDNLTAVMIFGVIILILAAVQSRSTEMSGELMSNYSGKKASLDLALLLEDDMDNLGKGIAPDSSFFVAPVQDLSDSSLTREFVFNLSVENVSIPGSMINVQRRYRLVNATLVNVNSKNIQTYQVISEERVDSTGSYSPWIDKWNSEQSLTYFNVTMKDDKNNNTAFADSARYIRVAFTLLPRHQQNNQYLREMNWNTTINVRPY